MKAPWLMVWILAASAPAAAADLQPRPPWSTTDTESSVGRIQSLADARSAPPSLRSAGSLVQLDPFAQATSRIASCPVAKPRLYTNEEAGTHAHARVERGTRCAMEGTCEPGGAYRRDPEINEAVRMAIAGEKRFANTSVWVTTSRRWVTLEGCVASKAERDALVKFVTKQPRVERVFDELEVRSK